MTRPRPELELKRVQWRCRRGLLELDLILQDFLTLKYERLTDAEREDFLQMLELPDNELLDFFHLNAEPEQENIRQIIKKIL